MNVTNRPDVALEPEEFARLEDGEPLQIPTNQQLIVVYPPEEDEEEDETDTAEVNL